jgi:hypothetical protein
MCRQPRHLTDRQKLAHHALTSSRLERADLESIDDAVEVGPIACSLGQAELAERRRRWHRLGDRALLAVVSTGAAVQVTDPRAS